MISMYSRQYKIGKIIINVNVELCFYLEIGTKQWVFDRGEKICLNTKLMTFIFQPYFN